MIMSRGFNQSRRAEPSTRGSIMPVSRILVVLLAVAAAIIVPWQLQVKSAHNRTREAIDAAMAAAEKKGDGLYKKDLDQYLHGSPTRQAIGKDAELFIWKGILPVSYHMRIEYGDGGFIKKAEWY